MLAKILGILKFAAFMTLLAVIYGIAHDLVTANVAVEYFTVYHPHPADSNSPVVMALLWGIIATWWVGLPAGSLIGASNVIGKKPSLPWNTVRKRAIIAMVVLWLMAMAVLIIASLLYGFVPRTPVAICYSRIAA